MNEWSECHSGYSPTVTHSLTQRVVVVEVAAAAVVGAIAVVPLRLLVAAVAHE